MKAILKSIVLSGVVVLGVFSGLAGIANAFSPVALFGTLVPKDGGVTATTDIPYGAIERQKLDIYRPEGGTGPYPVIYFSYGGGWEGGEKADYRFLGQAFAAQGYVVVVADYRLVPEVVYPDFVEDNALAIAWVQQSIAQFGGDPEQLVLMGHSAGAYNVMMIGMVEAFGIPRSSIKGIVGLSGPYDFYPFDVSQSVNAFGGFAEPEQTQPVNLISDDLPPVFLGHGDQDRTVLLRNSVALAEGMTAAGNQVTVKVYEGANHADTLITIAMPLRWRYPVFEDVLGFLRSLG
jgi:acetyl esterase/lipase